eukprot:1185156-Prorocentrum_minimum.AAC.1
MAYLAVKGHGRGPEVINPEGAVTYMGVRCLRLREDGRTLLSGGADGVENALRDPSRAQHSQDSDTVRKRCTRSMLRRLNRFVTRACLSASTCLKFRPVTCQPFA